MKKYMLLWALMLVLSGLLFAQDKSPYQSPVDKMADVLINYSLELQPGEKLAIITSPIANDLNLALLKYALMAGAHPDYRCRIHGAEETFLKYADNNQLTHVSEVDMFEVQYYDAMVFVGASKNVKTLNNLEPEKRQLIRDANKAYVQSLWRRIDDKELKWCYVIYPTDAYAQEADMGTEEYKEFVFEMCKLNEVDPVAKWKELALNQTKWIDRLKGKDRLELKGPNIDLTMSIKDRTFLAGDGKENFPDGEIYCSPVENSTNGWIKFNYPSDDFGNEIQDLELWFENGKVTQYKASKGEEFFKSLIETDEGASILGEIGIGTNYEIKRFTKNTLFDEKMGGTIHLAVGMGFPESGGTNESAMHHDMVFSMRDSQILVDGELFYENGNFVE